MATSKSPVVHQWSPISVYQSTAEFSLFTWSGIASVDVEVSRRVGFDSLLDSRAKDLDFAGIGRCRDVNAERAVLDGHSALVYLHRVFDAAFRHVIALVKAFGFLDFVDRNGVVVDIHNTDVNRHGRITGLAGIHCKRSRLTSQNARLLQAGTEAFDLLNGNTDYIIKCYIVHRSRDLGSLLPRLRQDVI